METTIVHLKCQKYKEAYEVCLEEKCKYSALICIDSNCQCNQKHQRCNVIAKVSKIIALILNKSHEERDIDNKIFNTCDKLIKIITMFREEYQTMAENTISSLVGSKKKLHDLLKNNENKVIVPQTVLMLKKEIQLQQEKNNFEETLKRVIQKRQKVEKFLQEELKGIKNIVMKDSTKVNNHMTKITNSEFGFDEEICHQNYQISNNNKNIKSRKQGDNFVFGLISPSIESIHSQKVKIKMKIINNPFNFLYFGMCHLNTIRDNQFLIKDKFKHGSYVCGSYNGSVYNQFDEKQNKTQSSFRAKTGDIIQLQCDKVKKMLIVTNTSNNFSLKANMKFQEKQNNPLHFCIYSHNLNTEVQIIQ